MDFQVPVVEKTQKPKAAGKSPDEMLRLIAEGTASVIGGDFFRSLAYHIIQATGIRYAIITECANIAKTRVRTLVYVERERILDNFEYDLEGTPCEIVMRGENYYCSADLDSFFAKEEGVKSYFAVPIFLANGEVIGHIAIFDSKPMEVKPEQLSILKIFASRAAAEIERKRKEELISDNVSRYQALFEGSPVGISEEDFSGVKSYIDELKSRYHASLEAILEKYPAEIHHAYDRIRRVDVNNALLAYFGVQSRDAYYDYLTKYFQPETFKSVLLAFDHGSTVFEREITVKAASGEVRHLKAKRALLPGAEKNWEKAILICMDITEQKESQENLKLALDEVKELKEQLEAENIYLRQEIKQDHNFDEIICKSEVFKKVLGKIELVADTDASVLILGESGTGKELIARAIHSVSKRSSRPLVKVNCAALPATLIESELFGHEKGAFTGALGQKIGRFELANGGTLFLDEIGELPLELQSKLLRVLQEGEFERVGSSHTLKVDVRVIAATNRDLEKFVNENGFRSDLYYRLNVFPIVSPPLRERKEDIPVLVNHFCTKHGMRLGRKVTSVSRQVLDGLLQYDWPGNVRELENVVERGLIISKSNVLEPGDWMPTANHQPHEVPIKATTAAAIKSLEDVERNHIVNTLIASNWKIRGDQGAAKILNLNPTTLEARMKKLGIKRPV